MVAKDICEMYENAEDKKKIIGILADMNECTRQDIKELLANNGYELPPEQKRGRKPQNRTIAEKKTVSIPESVKSACFARLEQLEKLINDAEREYREITNFITEVNDEKKANE